MYKDNDVMSEIYLKILKLKMFKENRDTNQQGKGIDRTRLAKR